MKCLQLKMYLDTAQGETVCKKNNNPCWCLYRFRTLIQVIINFNLISFLILISDKNNMSSPIYTSTQSTDFDQLWNNKVIYMVIFI